MNIFKKSENRPGRAVTAEALFMVGAPTTTPDLFDIEAVWPRPWRFLVTLSFSLALYGMFYAGWHLFNAPNMIPGVIFTGSFAVPVAALVLFFELNIRRNVSLYRVVTLVLGGGVLSLLLVLGLLNFEEKVFAFLGVSGDWYDSVRAPVEEIAKLAIAVLLAQKASYRFILNGLLIGAAVGAGFSAFESAGYALTSCLCEVATGGRTLQALQDAMMAAEHNLVVRGLFSPLSHIAWTALACAGLWWARKGGKLSILTFVNWRFAIGFIGAAVLHSLWNSPCEIPYYGKYLLLGAVAWVAIGCVVNAGVREIQNEQDKILKKI